MAKNTKIGDGATPSENAPIENLEQANAVIDSLKEIIAEQEAELSALKAATSGNEKKTVIEHEDKTYVAKVPAYKSGSEVVVLDKNVLEAKQKVFGKENVRLFDGEDIAALIEQNSPIIELLKSE